MSGPDTALGLLRGLRDHRRRRAATTASKPVRKWATMVQAADAAHSAARFLEGLPDTVPVPSGTEVNALSEELSIELKWHEFGQEPDGWGDGLADLIALFPGADWKADATYGLATVHGTNLHPGLPAAINVTVFPRASFALLAAAVGRLDGAL